MMQYSTLLLALLATAEAAVIAPSLSANEHYGVHTEFISLDTGDTIQLLIKGHNGPSITTNPSAVFVPTTNFTRVTSADGAVDLQRRDVCELITNCAGKCAESAKAFGTVALTATTSFCGQVANVVADYLSANNYANANTIIQGTVISFAINLATAPITYYINAAMDRFSAGTSSDACGQTQPATYTGDAASAIYQFCLAVQSEKQESVTTRFDAADTTKSGATTVGNGGQQGLSKFFIASQAGTFAPICKDFGITWKRLAEAEMSPADHMAIEAF